MSEQQKFFQLVPSGTHIDFVGHRWRFITVSILLIVLSIGSLVYNQMTTGTVLNFGIDFAGGSQVQLALDPEKDVPVEDVRAALEDFGYEGASVVTVPERDNELLIRVKETESIDEATLERCEEAVRQIGDAQLVGFNHPDGGSKIFLKYDVEPNYRELETAINAAGCEGGVDKGFGGDEEVFPVEVALIGVGNKISEQLDDRFGAGTVIEIVRSETVGAKVGGQLKTDGAKSMLYAIGFIFLFVMIRFDLRFAPGGIVALLHDATIVVGTFAITGKEFNLQTVAALLTVVGYSINDTIVVFDRVRERVALHRDDPLEKTTNDALNDTLSRTILTSGTTLLVVTATYLLGAGPIKDFAFALIVGVLVGTFSSLYIASPVFLWVNKRFYGGKGHLQWIDDKEREGTGMLLQPSEPKPGDEGPTAAGAEESEAAAPEDVVKRTRRRRRRRPDALKPGPDEDGEA
jgi:preprotein translocase subunit SecF